MGERIKLSPIIGQLRKYEIPVKVLEYIDRHGGAELGDSDDVSGIPGFQTLKLTLDTIRSLKKISPSYPTGESTALGTLYHEATHRYLLLRSEEQIVKKLRTSGEKYYKNAPLERKETADDPERLFQEAAGEYVDHRVATWWRTLESIVNFTEKIQKYVKHPLGVISMAESMMINEIDYFVKKVRDVPKNYNKEMGKRIFGYENKWKGCNRTQTPTIKKMPEKLKQFCDTTILEDKITDNFIDAGFLVKRYRPLLILIVPLSLIHTSRTVRGGGRTPGIQLK